jgi:16S rRNA (uracil1498-N3)-methyltransferase
MEPPLFFAAPDRIRNDRIDLPTTEAHHALQVMRLRSGSPVVVIDGVGNAYKGELAVSKSKSAEVLVHSIHRNYGEPSVRLTLAAGLSTGYKFDDVVEKGTELGVKRFVPLISEKSKVKVESGDKAKSKTARLEKVALAAIKQCRRAYLPEISHPTEFKSFMGETDRESLNLIFVTTAGAESIDRIEIDDHVNRVTVLVGPESGFTPAEVQQAIERGYKPVSMGKRILRTETAGPVSVALVMIRIGELR